MLPKIALATLLALPLSAQGYYINSDKPDSPICPQLTIENDPRLTRGERGATLDATRNYHWGIKTFPIGERPDLSAVTFYDESKKGVSIASLRGKLVIIGLWGYRCQPSARMLMEMAKVLKVKDRYDFEVWAINYDANRMTEDATSLGGWAAIRRFQMENAGSFKEMPLSLGVSGPGDENPGHFIGVIDSLPVMMVVDRTGHLATLDIGYTQGMVGQRLSQLIREEQAAKGAH
ncbi:MAG TPA: hypothetical protein VFF76_06270 [Holophagaceae bacterium]|jgi:hypothetical protein|nr:hypothetical protein [Holophagaceae bacterium]